MMERFADGLGAAERDAALGSLHGRGAFRRFKDTVYQFGLEKAWYGFRDDCYREVALRWCDAHDIAHDSSP